jgi:glycosyltransferase involved in cell wall biosynthesis
MKVAVVTPRYGRAVVGGAELAVRLLAEHLVASGDEVEVFTTNALDADAWHPGFNPGTTTEVGVTVHRFAVERGRADDFDARTRTTLRRWWLPSEEEQWAWIDSQGPLSAALDEAVHEADADVLAASPYLFPPVAHAVATSRLPVLFHPAAHDEPPLRLPVFADVFGAATGYAFYTAAESRVVESRFGFVASRPQRVVGLGVDTGAGDEASAREALLLGDRPFLLVLGRVDPGKGSDLIADFFAAYKARRPGPLALVFAGPIAHAPPTHRDVIVAGQVDERIKWGLLRGAEVLVSPSTYESFSFVLLEAWTAGTPTLVHAACAATVEHAEASGAGVAFNGYASFEVALDRLLGSPELCTELARRGRRYVDDRFRWPSVVERYRDLAAVVAASR